MEGLTDLTLLLGMLSEELINFLLTVYTAEEFLDFNLALELHKSIEYGFGSWGATGDINVDGDNFIDTGENAIRILERASGDGATAASDDILGLSELLIETAEDRSHTMDDSALDHDIVSLTRGVTSHLETETRHIIASSAKRHKLNSAAACAEAEGPERVGYTPLFLNASRGMLLIWSNPI